MKKMMSFLFAAAICTVSLPSFAVDKAAMEETNPPPASGPLDSSSIPIPADTMPKPQNPGMMQQAPAKPLGQPAQGAPATTMQPSMAAPAQAAPATVPQPSMPAEPATSAQPATIAPQAPVAPPATAAPQAPIAPPATAAPQATNLPSMNEQ